MPRRAPPSVTQLLADSVLPRESSISSLRLAALVPHLDRKPSLERLAIIAASVPAKVRRQVQRLTNNAEPDANLSYLVMMKESKDGDSTVVFLHGAGIELDAITALRRWLTPQQARSVVEAMLDMVGEPENTPANKVFLLQRLAQLAEIADEQTAKLIFGQLERSLIVPVPIAETVDSLSPLTMNLGSAADAAGWALYCAGTTAAKHPSLLVDRFLPHLERGLVSTYPQVRGAAVAAAGELPSAPSSLINHLIAATGDIAPEVSISAFSALSLRPELALNETQWQFLARTIRTGLTHRSSSVRRASAGAVRCLESGSLLPEQVHIVNELRGIVQHDLSFSVRESLLGENQEPLLGSCAELKGATTDAGGQRK